MDDRVSKPEDVVHGNVFLASVASILLDFPVKSFTGYEIFLM